MLLAYSKNKHCFYLPGGKVDDGETAQEALCREIQEELNVELLQPYLQYHTHISAPAFGEGAGIIMEQDCFFYKEDVTPTPAAEIGEIRFFSLGEYLEEVRKAPGAIMILEQLKQEGLID